MTYFLDHSPDNDIELAIIGWLRILPNKTHTFKGEACHGGKQAKDRLTVLVATNATGTEKLPLLVIVINNTHTHTLRVFYMFGKSDH